MTQILFLANPCCSSNPRLPNLNKSCRKPCQSDVTRIETWSNISKQICTCGKQIGIPPLTAFGGLKIAYNTWKKQAGEGDLVFGHGITSWGSQQPIFRPEMVRNANKNASQISYQSSEDGEQFKKRKCSHLKFFNHFAENYWIVIHDNWDLENILRLLKCTKLIFIWL